MTIYVVRGREDFLAERFLKELFSGNVSVTRITEPDPEMILGMLEGSVFFGEAIVYFETEVLGAEEKLFSALKDLEGAEGLFVIRAFSVRENTKLWKWLSAKARVVSCEPLSEKDYREFLQRENKRRENPLSKEGLSLFFERSAYGVSDTDLFTVDAWLSELELLKRSGEAVTLQDISEAVRADDVNSAFELIGCLTKKDFPGLFDRAGNVKGDVLMTLGALLYSLRILSKLRVAAPGEIGVTDYQTRSVRPLLFLSEKETDSLLYAVSEGIRLSKSGVDGDEVLSQVLSELCRIVSGGERTV